MKVLSALFCIISAVSAAAAQGWEHWGGDLAGRRYADVPGLSPDTVAGLEEAWRVRTGDVTDGEGYFNTPSNFKATPILVSGKLVLSTPFNRVIALDPATGEELWRFDPEVDFSVRYSEMFTSRGVAAYVDPDTADDAPCNTTIFLGTLDARLIAVDGETGEPCAAFGEGGEVDLTEGIGRVRRGEYSVTSPPTVVNGVVVVGSSIGDNGGARLEDGTVRGYDARTGAFRWAFHPVPQDSRDPGAEQWPDDSYRETGAANVWGVMAADAERDLVFLPTTSPSPDFYGGHRPGTNAHANSVVALKATTGEVVWTYQLVHHDLWDYDLAAQPLLAEVNVDGEQRAVVAQATKMGFVFVLDRETGEPIHAVEERPVPASDVKGEAAWPTQRFPLIQLHQVTGPLPPIFAENEEHAAQCEAMMDGVRYEGIFTPPSLEGTVLYPGNPGGVNWGSMAFNPESGVAFVAVNRLPTVMKLIPRRDFRKLQKEGVLNGVEAQHTAQSGTPYGMARFGFFNNESGFHCLEGPWSTLVAVDLVTGETKWEMPAGRRPGLDDDHPAANWGYLANSGPVATSGGLVFLATQYDRALWAYNLASGELVWQQELPAGPQATPMAYQHDGESYVVLALGGTDADDKQGDYVIAYKVP